MVLLDAGVVKEGMDCRMEFCMDMMIPLLLGVRVCMIFAFHLSWLKQM